MKWVKKHFCVEYFWILSVESCFQGLKKIISMKWVKKHFCLKSFWICICGTILNLNCGTILNLNCGTILNFSCGTILNLNHKTIFSLKCGTILNLKRENLLNYLYILTHLFPMHPFLPTKHRENQRVFRCFRGFNFS